MINNGIINFGNNNTNTITKIENYNDLKQELTSLLNHIEKNEKDYQTVSLAIYFCKEKEESKLKECLKLLSKKTIQLIPKLGLIAIEKLIENLIF